MALFGTVTLDREIIEDAMLRRGWYRYDLAEKAGVSSATLQKAFKQKPVSVGTARDIAEALNISIRKIIKETHSAGADFSVALLNVGSALRGEEQ